MYHVIKVHVLQVSRGGVSRWIVQSGGEGETAFLTFSGINLENRLEWSRRLPTAAARNGLT